jgi:hypothetical protein
MDMARKGRSTEEIIQALPEAEVRLGQCKTVVKICRGLGISKQTYYIYGRREYGGLKLDQAKRLKPGTITSGLGRDHDLHSTRMATNCHAPAV